MNTILNKKAAAFAGGVVSMACLVACGDDVTRITNVGVDSVAAYEDLSECTAKDEGSLVYVKDKGATYLCSDESWRSVKGENGKNGDDGKNGTNGTSCTVKELTDGSGFDVLCGDKKVGTLKNGVSGKAGANGTSCSLSENAAKNGYDLVCGDKTVTVKDGDKGENCTGTLLESGNIKITCGTTVIGELQNGANGVNGTNGKSAYELSGYEGSEKDWLATLNGKNGENCTVENVTGGVKVTCNGVSKTITNGTNGSAGTNGTGCSIESDVGGVVTVACGTAESPVKATLYKAVCGKEPYDPDEKFCVGVDLYDPCDGKTYDPAEYKCVENQLQEIAVKCNGIKYDPEKQFCAKRGTTEERPYKMVTIAPEGTTYSKTWMAENLNYATDNSFCYEGIDANCDTYGRLYTWDAAVGKSEDECGYGHECGLPDDVQGVCPDGWRLPTKAEWEALIVAVDDQITEYEVFNAAGKALKSTSGWDGDGNGSDAFGFSALPTGYRTKFGTYVNSPGQTFFWSSTENGTDYAYNLTININKNANSNNLLKNLGYSVRCIQNDSQ